MCDLAAARPSPPGRRFLVRKIGTAVIGICCEWWGVIEPFLDAEFLRWEVQGWACMRRYCNRVMVGVSCGVAPVFGAARGNLGCVQGIRHSSEVHRRLGGSVGPGTAG